MTIHWYPGHMHKANKEMAEVLPQVDVIIELLDARIPYSSENPLIQKLASNKPHIKLLNKSDLADPEITQQWQQYFEENSLVKTLAVNNKLNDRNQKIIDLCYKLAGKKSNAVKNLLVMITGIPNVGKSSLINSLAGKMIAKTGNEPAITKGQQRINLGNGIMLLDTPGILWPKVAHENSSYRLATTGAIKDTAMSYDDVSFFAAEYLLANYPTLLTERFKLDALPPSELEFLETIGIKRGCLRSGGRVDLERIGTIFLNELRAGTLGQISFETPSMVEKEKAEVKAEEREKELKQQQRLEANKAKKRKAKKR